MERKTRGTGASVLVALGGLLAAFVLFASPAGAEKSGTAKATDDSTASGGCYAAHGSVCSGSGVAINDSTSSGDAIATDGSVSSGCAQAHDVSTASGGVCAPEKAPVTTTPPGAQPKPKGPGGEEVPEARAARARGARELAFTGSATGPMVATGAAALVLGFLLLQVGSDRRRPVTSS